MKKRDLDIETEKLQVVTTVYNAFAYIWETTKYVIWNLKFCLLLGSRESLFN